MSGHWWTMLSPDNLAAVAQALFLGSVLPTVWNQWKTRRSSIPLSATFITFTALLLLMASFIQLHLWQAVGVVVVTLSLWVILAGQRIRYGDGG